MAETTYQEFAARTLNGNPELTDLERLSNFLIGLVGEVIELGPCVYHLAHCCPVNGSQTVAIVSHPEKGLQEELLLPDGFTNLEFEFEVATL